MATPIDTTAEATAAPEAARPRRLRRTLGWVAAIALAGASMYLVVMTVWWGMHVAQLRADTDELSSTLAETERALVTAAAELEAARALLEDEVRGVIEFANVKAQGEDFRILYADAAIAMESCATEMGVVVEGVYNRDLYYAWSLRAVEDDVTAYCNELSATIAELDAEREMALP